MLKEVYGDEQMSKASFYLWFNRFYEGNKQVGDEPEKHRGSAKVSDARPLNNCEDDI